jgi:hypothetical protein
MTDMQPTIPGLEEPQPEDGPLVLAARKSIAARREHGAIMPWHETLCAAVIELAQQAQRAKGIAKAQLYAQMLAAEAKLPEPVIQENSDVVDYELDRIRQYVEQLAAAPADPADVPDEAQSAPVL